MKFHVLTLFPEMILRGCDNSILARAMARDLIEVEAVNIRDYTQNKHGRVDDYTYGGGAGLLMQAQPVYDAFEAVRTRIEREREPDEEQGCGGPNAGAVSRLVFSCIHLYRGLILMNAAPAVSSSISADTA